MNQLHRHSEATPTGYETTPAYKLLIKKQATSYETFARTQMKHMTTPATHFTL